MTRHPIRQVSLSDTDGRVLGELATALGFTGKRLAELAGVKQPWLSQVLNGQRKRVDSEMLERVASVLVEQLKSRPGDSRFPEERVRVALTLLSRFTFTAASSIPPKVYP